MGDNAYRVNSTKPVVLKLYVSGDGPRSQGAIRRLHELSAGHLDCEVQVIDVNRHPELAERERILATPALVKESPLPIRRIVGDLTDTPALLLLLDLADPVEESR